MSAHPNAAGRDLAQQPVEVGAVAPLVNRVDPDEYTIELYELCSHGVEDVVLVNHRLRIDADVGERREDGLEPTRLWRSSMARRFIAPPKDCDAAEASCGFGNGKRTRIHCHAPSPRDCAAREQDLDGDPPSRNREPALPRYSYLDWPRSAIKAAETSPLRHGDEGTSRRQFNPTKLTAHCVALAPTS